MDGAGCFEASAVRAWALICGTSVWREVASDAGSEDDDKGDVLQPETPSTFEDMEFVVEPDVLCVFFDVPETDELLFAIFSVILFDFEGFCCGEGVFLEARDGGSICKDPELFLACVDVLTGNF